VNKKKQKNFIYAGPWALSPTPPMAQHNQKFLRRFFQKAASFLSKAWLISLPMVESHFSCALGGFGRILAVKKQGETAGKPADFAVLKCRSFRGAGS
jgi:hypothetical protein